MNMLLRVFSFLLLLMFSTSCTNFSFKKKSQSQELDTIINFSSVDASPFFTSCKDFIDAAKTDCFRKTIHKKIAANLSKHQLKVKDSINEVVTINLLISSKGKINLKEIKSSEALQKQLPKLDSLLKISVNELPQIYPANKRGIPVTTQYSLPIKIQLK